MNLIVVEPIFNVEEKSYYPLEIILNSDNKKKQLLFTSSQSIYDQYIHTGELGFRDIFLADYSSYIRSIEDVMMPESITNKKIELGVYTHFKNKDYEVLGTALNINKKTHDVIYSQLYSSEKYDINQIWSRDYKDFFSFVRTKLDDGSRYFGPRFNFMTEKNN